MEIKKEKLEDFKTAISSTVRSLSNSEKIEVSFGAQTPKSEKNSIKLPELDQINNKLNYNQIRAIADSKSLRFRFSDKEIFKQYEPKGNISKQLYRISEKIRCEKIGTSYFKGVKNNIEKFYQKRISGLDLKNSEDRIIESFENYLRTKFLDFKNDNQQTMNSKLIKVRQVFDNYPLIPALHSFLSIKEEKYKIILPPLTLLHIKKKEELLIELKKVNFIVETMMAA